MPGFLQEHLRPLAGSAGLHLVLLAVLAGAALRWTSSQPPVELAIEGYVVEGPVKVRPLPGPREPAVATRPPETTAPPAAPEAPVEQPTETPAPDAAELERAAQLERARLEAESQAAAAARARHEAEQAEARRKAQEAEANRKAAEEEARRKAEAAEAAKRQAEAEARAGREAEAQARREAAARAEREAALQRRLAAEEEAAAFARSGVIDEYRSLLVQTIERNWIRPPSARAGLECTLYVTQAPGGTVVDVRLGACNGDEPVRESIVTAVHKSSPLPAPRDPRAFERRLEIVFKPME
jgi:colicin import membrane protein